MTQAQAFSYAGMPLAGVDANGVLWTIESADGWFGATQVRSNREARSGVDGDWPSTPLRAGRVVTLRGNMFNAPTVAALEQTLRTFASVPLVGDLAADSDWGTLTGSGHLEDAPTVSPTSAASAAWQLVIGLPDPLLYGPDTFDSTGLNGVSGTGRVWSRVWPRDWGVPTGVTPGAIAVSNAGTAAYWPRLRIDGPVDRPVVTVNETGDWVRYNGSLAAGQYLDIDCANRRVLLNGFVSKAPLVTFSGRWLAIPPGGGSVSWNADSADAAAKLSVFGREGAWS